MDKDAVLQKIRDETREIYKNASHDLSFHGWHHIDFVHRHSLRFCKELGADPFLVAVAAYIHDLNYVVKVDSAVDAGYVLRSKMLRKYGFDEDTILHIERIIKQADTIIRSDNISPESKALSDGDTLFKALPITPVFFANSFMREKTMSIRKLADFILKTQIPLMEQGIYFYSNDAKQYMKWAETNLELWKNVAEYMAMPELTVDTSSLADIDKYL